MCNFPSFYIIIIRVVIKSQGLGIFSGYEEVDPCFFFGKIQKSKTKAVHYTRTLWKYLADLQV